MTTYKKNTLMFMTTYKKNTLMFMTTYKKNTLNDTHTLMYMTT